MASDGPPRVFHEEVCSFTAIGTANWLDVAAATLGIYAAIAGTGWLLFGQPGIGLAAWGVASLLLWLAVRGAVTTDPE